MDATGMPGLIGNGWDVRISLSGLPLGLIANAQCELWHSADRLSVNLVDESCV